MGRCRPRAPRNQRAVIEAVARRIGSAPLGMALNTAVAHVLPGGDDVTMTPTRSVRRRFQRRDRRLPTCTTRAQDCCLDRRRKELSLALFGGRRSVAIGRRRSFARNDSTPQVNSFRPPPRFDKTTRHTHRRCSANRVGRQYRSANERVEALSRVAVGERLAYSATLGTRPRRLHESRVR